MTTNAYLYPDGTMCSSPIPGKRGAWAIDIALFDIGALVRMTAAERTLYYPTGIVRTADAPRNNLETTSLKSGRGPGSGGSPPGGE